jgi:hypothetical protein
MTEKKKYQILIIAALCVFAYVLLTEATDRLSGTIRDYTLLKDREKQVLNQEELIQKKSDLTVQKKVLTAQITHGNKQYEQDQVGIVKFLQVSAKEANILMSSLTPLEVKAVAQMNEHSFKAEIVGTYHKLGAFINALETGAIPVRVVKVDASAQRPGSAVITAVLEGKAFVLSKDAAK